jgi:hypothetical protein
MIQPATLRLESNGGQQNSTYFAGDAFHLVLTLQVELMVLMLQVQLLVLMLLILAFRSSQLALIFTTLANFSLLTALPSLIYSLTPLKFLLYIPTHSLLHFFQ